MSEHFIKYCVACEKIMGQCRCPSETKSKKYGVCDICTELYCDREHLGICESSIFIGYCHTCGKPFLPKGKIK